MRCFKQLLAVLLTVAVLVPLTGCGLQVNSTGPVTLRIAYYPDVVDLKPLLAEYSRNHPTVTIETFELTENNFPSLMDEVDKGNIDIVREYPDTLISRVRTGAFEPLDGYIESGDWGKLQGDYFKGTWEGLQTNGQQYAVPASVDMYVTYVNLNIFKNADVQPPDASWTIDDLLAKASAVNQPEGRPGGNPPVVFGFGTYYLSPDPVIFTYLHGGTIVDNFNNPNVAYLDSQTTVEALSFYTNLIRQYKFSPSASIFGAYFGYAGVPLPAMQGYCALWFDLFSKRGSTVDESGLVNKWPFAWQILPLPKDVEAISLGNVDGYYLPASSQHKREALELVRWLADQPEAAGIRFPVRKSLAQDKAYTARIGGETARIGSMAAENLVIMPGVYWLYGSHSIMRTFYDTLRGIEKGDDPQAALEKAQSAVMQQILESQQEMDGS